MHVMLSSLNMDIDKRMCSTLTQGTVTANLDVSLTAPGHLFHHCLVLSLIDDLVECDGAFLPQEPATTRLCHSIADFMHRNKAHNARLIVNT